jgi:hypothetical protein
VGALGLGKCGCGALGSVDAAAADDENRAALRQGGEPYEPRDKNVTPQPTPGTGRLLEGGRTDDDPYGLDRRPLTKDERQGL